MRLILFAILFTAVYSWEEIVTILSRIGKKLSHNHHYGSNDYESDEFVTTALLIFAIPLGILYYLKSGHPLTFKLTVIFIELTFITIVAAGVKLFWKRLAELDKYSGWEKAGVVMFALIGLVSPALRLYYSHPRSLQSALGRLALFLTIPILVGLILLQFKITDITSPDIIPNIDDLIVVLIGGLFITITIKFLENHFRRPHVHILTYFRVALGVLIIFILGQGI